ncbi:acetate kinase [Corynebacterium mycetoides]|uniref:Acetate kinase n=1 Tax=Corynebacterium mycetoides TaxID=38302 RepID=A0A1G9P9E4_9CORY|nr:acetate kinase [Corynebacterium mycetoides]SDL94817.1 acetate kinase [Corynebacterium mycetoides]
MSYVLVINSGSSSIKFQIVDPSSTAGDTAFVSGLVEKIGERGGKITVTYRGEKHTSNQPIRDHRGGLQLAVAMLDSLDAGPTQLDVVAVGHRVVHGGQTFSGPALITDEVVEQIRDLIPLAPLHNPANIDGIQVARDLLPDIPHVAVFDTGFFGDLPAAAATYAVNREVAEANQIRRYGFHGTSHEFVSGQVPGILGRDAAEVNQIVLHLGNGASCSAVKAGAPIDTSMGLTPLAGLVMGTRTGDIDPGIIFHLYRHAGMSIDEIDTLFNRSSGIKGLSGVNDFRDLHKKISKGDELAKLAFDVYITQLRRYIGAYMITLGRVDAITFTAGVGENDAATRAAALAGLETYGITLDPERNAAPNDGPRVITTDDSTVTVLVVPTNEELAIAQKSAEVAAR